MAITIENLSLRAYQFAILAIIGLMCAAEGGALKHVEYFKVQVGSAQGCELEMLNVMEEALDAVETAHERGHRLELLVQIENRFTGQWDTYNFGDPEDPWWQRVLNGMIDAARRAGGEDLANTVMTVASGFLIGSVGLPVLTATPLGWITMAGLAVYLGKDVYDMITLAVDKKWEALGAKLFDFALMMASGAAGGKFAKMAVSGRMKGYVKMIQNLRRAITKVSTKVPQPPAGIPMISSKYTHKLAKRSGAVKRANDKTSNPNSSGTRSSSAGNKKSPDASNASSTEPKNHQKTSSTKAQQKPDEENKNIGNETNPEASKADKPLESGPESEFVSESGRNADGSPLRAGSKLAAATSPSTGTIRLNPKMLPKDRVWYEGLKKSTYVRATSLQGKPIRLWPLESGRKVVAAYKLAGLLNLYLPGIELKLPIAELKSFEGRLFVAEEIPDFDIPMASSVRNNRLRVQIETGLEGEITANNYTLIAWFDWLTANAYRKFMPLAYSNKLELPSLEANVAVNTHSSHWRMWIFGFDRAFGRDIRQPDSESRDFVYALRRLNWNEIQSELSELLNPKELAELKARKDTFSPALKLTYTQAFARFFEFKSPQDRSAILSMLEETELETRFRKAIEANNFAEAEELANEAMVQFVLVKMFGSQKVYMKTPQARTAYDWFKYVLKNDVLAESYLNAKTIEKYQNLKDYVSGIQKHGGKAPKVLLDELLSLRKVIQQDHPLMSFYLTELTDAVTMDQVNHVLRFLAGKVDATEFTAIGQSTRRDVMFEKLSEAARKATDGRPVNIEKFIQAIDKHSLRLKAYVKASEKIEELFIHFHTNRHFAKSVFGTSNEFEIKILVEALIFRYTSLDSSKLPEFSNMIDKLKGEDPHVVRETYLQECQKTKGMVLWENTRFGFLFSNVEQFHMKDLKLIFRLNFVEAINQKNLDPNYAAKFNKLFEGWSDKEMELFLLAITECEIKAVNGKGYKVENVLAKMFEIQISNFMQNASLGELRMRLYSFSAHIPGVNGKTIKKSLAHLTPLESAEQPGAKNNHQPITIEEPILHDPQLKALETTAVDVMQVVFKNMDQLSKDQCLRLIAEDVEIKEGFISAAKSGNADLAGKFVVRRLKEILNRPHTRNNEEDIELASKLLNDLSKNARRPKKVQEVAKTGDEKVTDPNLLVYEPWSVTEARQVKPDKLPTLVQSAYKSFVDLLGKRGIRGMFESGRFSPVKWAGDKTVHLGDLMLPKNSYRSQLAGGYRVIFTIDYLEKNVSVFEIADYH